MGLAGVDQTKGIHNKFWLRKTWNHITQNIPNLIILTNFALGYCNTFCSFLILAT